MMICISKSVPPHDAEIFTIYTNECVFVLFRLQLGKYTFCDVKKNSETFKRGQFIVVAAAGLYIFFYSLIVFRKTLGKEVVRPFSIQQCTSQSDRQSISQSSSFVSSAFHTHYCGLACACRWCEFNWWQISICNHHLESKSNRNICA